MRVLLDTNILLRLTETGHQQHQLADKAVEMLLELGEELVVVPQIFYEYWAVVTRPVAQNGIGLSVAQANSNIQSFQHMFRFLRDERTVFEFWYPLVTALDVKGKQAHDARLAAAMQRHSVTHLLTFNGADFKRFPFVQVIEPSSLLLNPPAS
ncbi:type II toxin-antitoxin system VapC family toxin [Anatilimnocola sp. NA78]|uniref:type II toxin-antitoxin system VapC family toxin n=1 Tax=Anatilimnocola sp. NA78 TaxID=3415683 RepID=UPI003CE46E21